MNKLSFLFFALLIAGFAAAQSPVTWTYSSKKISDNVYEVQLKATIESGWHLYSQTQPKDAIAQPTSISFSKNPLLEFDGKTKEVGKVQKFVDKELDVSANQYSNTVSFVQKVKVKGKVKTNVTGKLEYQVCTEEKCLPAKTVAFNVALK